jgi:hypothetical protein
MAIVAKAAWASASTSPKLDNADLFEGLGFIVVPVILT